MLLATWNLNHRVGKTRFRPEAADAAVALNADVIIFTEYFPQGHHAQFADALAEAGLSHQLLSRETGERANRVFIASRLPLEEGGIAPPAFDGQFPANIVSAFLPTVGLHLLGVRVPAYPSKDNSLLTQSWEWLETAAASLKNKPAVLLGDLNVGATSPKSMTGRAFARIQQDGWTRAAPDSGHSYLGHRGKSSEIDHLLATEKCVISQAKYVTDAGGFVLVRKDLSEPVGLSDHASLVAKVIISGV